ncbi:Triacylglycerol lipase 2 [Linum grandiflorum]
MVQSQGYACEEHLVTTEDGYILGIQRMQVSRSGKKAHKPPVLVQHGLFSDGASWMINSPTESLPFILVDNGYDVWISNTRGTVPSQGHTSLSPNDGAYWEWSWDQLAAYDLPAVFHYVFDHTRQKHHYIGHSLGTLTVLAALSQGDLFNMTRSAALLCPIAHLNHITSPAKIAADLYIAEDLYGLGLREFEQGGLAFSKFLKGVCSQPGINCSDLITAFTGGNCCVNVSRIDEFLDNEPQATSVKNIVHLSQMMRRGTITKYDYGNKDANMDHYGQPNPPVYKMSMIHNSFPLFFGYGGQDKLSDVDDMQILIDNLKDHDQNKLVLHFVDYYSHTDFVFGVNASVVVYDPIMDFFNLN